MHRFALVLCAAILAADGHGHNNRLVKCDATNDVVKDVVDVLCYYGVPQPGEDGECKMQKNSLWDLVIATNYDKFRGGLFEDGARAVRRPLLERWAKQRRHSCLVAGDDYVSTECLYFLVHASSARSLRRTQLMTERDVARDLLCCDAPQTKKSPLCELESGITLIPLAKVAQFNNLTKVPMSCVLAGDEYCI